MIFADDEPLTVEISPTGLSLRAIDYFNIDIQEIKYKFPTKLIIKSLIQYQKKGIQNCLKEYETFLRNHQKELKWLLNIELKPNEIDYHPNLRYLQEIK